MNVAGVAAMHHALSFGKATARPSELAFGPAHDDQVREHLRRAAAAKASPFHLGPPDKAGVGAVYHPRHLGT